MHAARPGVRSRRAVLEQGLLGGVGYKFEGARNVGRIGAFTGRKAWIWRSPT
jgi:hypothetical protein